MQAGVRQAGVGQMHAEVLLSFLYPGLDWMPLVASLWLVLRRCTRVYFFLKRQPKQHRLTRS